MWKGLFGSDNNVCITVKGNLFPDTFPPCSQCYSFFKKSDILAWLKLMQKLPVVSTGVDFTLPRIWGRVGISLQIKIQEFLALL